MAFLSNAEVSVWYCHDLSASCCCSIQELSWILSGILVLGNHSHSERVQRQDVTLCTVIYLDCDVIYAVTVWQLYLQDCEDLGFALWVCIIAYAGHRLWPRNGRKWFLNKISTFLMVLKGVGSMEVFLLISMRVCTFSMEVIWMVLKEGWLNAVGTLGHWLASRPGPRRLTFALTSSGCAMGLSVSSSWLFRPRTCTEMIFYFHICDISCPMLGIL